MTEQFPTSAESLLQSAINERRYSDAIGVLKNLLLAQPAKYEYHSLLIRLYLALGAPADALDACKAAQSSGIDSIEIVCFKAEALSKLGQLEDAIRSYSDGLLIDPTNRDCRLGVGSIFEISQHFELAIRHYKLVLLDHPSCGETLFRLFRCYLSINDIPAAVKIGRSLAKVDSHRSDFYQLAIKLATSSPSDPSVLLIASQVEIGQRNFKSARNYIERALAIAPNDEEICFVGATLLYLDGELDNMLKLQIRYRQLRIEKARSLGLHRYNLRFLGDLFTGPIGHLTLIELFLKMDKLGWLEPAQTVIFPGAWVSNRAYLSCFSKYYPIIDAPEEREMLLPLKPYLEEQLNVFPHPTRGYIHIYDAFGAAHRAWEAAGYGPTLSLPEEWEVRGRERLSSLGINPDQWFVTLHVRDTGRIDGQWKDPARSARCAHIESYFPLIKNIVNRGGNVIRIGDSLMGRLPEMSGVLDYAHHPHQEDWFQVFLFARCKFFVGTPSGPSNVPSSFGVKVLNTNWNSVVILPAPSRDLFLPKKIRNMKSGEIISFAEMAARKEFHALENLETLHALGYDLVDNTPDELVAAVDEMFAEIDGGSEAYTPLLPLRTQFEKVTLVNEFYGCGRVCCSYLRGLQALLVAHSET